MATLRVIKEPIHNYIAISKLENELINDPLFQRLHHISQNGTAYLTYPSNRTSRFIHSLGAMHLGGRMLRSALMNSERDIKAEFLKAFDTVIKDAESAVNYRLHQIQTVLRDSDDIFYRDLGFDPGDRSRTTEIVMLQSLRIACVLHDLGHPPFSHTTERVMESMIAAYVPSKIEDEHSKFVEILTALEKGEAGHLHEKIGAVLTNHVFSEAGGNDASLAQVGRFCFRVASRIANPDLAEHDPSGVLRCLGSIVSRKGYDCDRGDYVLRDGYASSFEFGEYDVERIIDNLRVCKLESKDFALVAMSSAMSALESFFVERYRVWRWLVFHHSVTRSHVALSRALAILLEIEFGKKGASAREDELRAEIRALLRQAQFTLLWRAFETPATYRQYVRCDEHWLIALLRNIQLSGSLRGALPRQLAMLKTYLDFLLDRKKSAFRTLWKRTEEYRQFAARVEKSFNEIIKKLTPTQQNKLENLKRKQKKKESSVEWFNRVIVRYLTDARGGEISAMRNFEAKLQTKLAEHSSFKGAILLAPLHLNMQVDCPVMDKDGNLLSICDLSTMVNDLPSTWSRDIQIRMYWVGLKKKGSMYAADPHSSAPGIEDLAPYFLEAIFGGTNWTALKTLIGDTEN